MRERDLTLTERAAARIRAAIARARGNEVCFLAQVGVGGEVEEPRVVARGHGTAVLAAVGEAEPGMLVIHNHPSGELAPSDADIEVAARLHEEGVGLAITDNGAQELYVVVEPVSKREHKRLDEAVLDAVLAPGGPVAALHPGYEDRPAQREMTQAVARAYNEGGVALVEAGTGTGKSIAYLLPALRWALANRERTLVSTNTINLQEQLVGKDLPFLRRALAEPFRYALVKGRQNYVSIRRARLAAEAAPVLLDGGQRAELEAIVEWLQHTREGSLQDLPFAPTPEVWEEVASESDVCLRAKCPTFEACFYQRARRAAASADVLVVNHHLLFSDLAVRRAQGNYTAPAVLPPYRRVVLDEAHNIEDAATSHLGANVSRRGLLRLLGRLERRGRGLLPAFEERLKRGEDDLLQQDALRMITRTLRPALERAREATSALFDRLETVIERAPESVLRLADSEGVRPDWAASLDVAVENLLGLLGDVARGLAHLRERIQLDRDWAESLEERLLELRGAAGRLEAALQGLRLALVPGEDPFPTVRWLERRGGPGRANVAVRAAPVDLSEALREALFDQVDTAVLTSATLATRSGFDFLRSRIGLARGGLRLSEAVLPSPFEYETQTVLAIPTDLPEPRAGAGEAFDRATTDVVAELAGLSDGGVFALFTSYRSLRAVAAGLRARRLEARWPLFVQGEGSRARLLERFTESGRGILLGVASFWEGVDVPGDPLRGLVIAKLPFLVPNEPLTAARLEAIDRDGGNSFHDYLLPHAALRLKQGFGRLIRSRTDRGAIVLLDRRVVERNYGRYFLESLPAAPVRTGPWSVLRGELERFYGERLRNGG